MKTRILLTLFCMLIGQNSLMTDCANSKYPTKDCLIQHIPGEYSVEIFYVQDSSLECIAHTHHTLVATELYSIIKRHREEFINNHYESGNYVTEYNPESKLSIKIIPQIYESFFNIEIRIFAMIRGCAHGYQSIETINYDISKQRIMRISDLFPKTVNYLEKVCAMSRAALKEKFTEQSIEYRDLADYGTMPINENYETWQLNSQGLEIIFNPSQVTSACNGEQRILLDI